MENTLEFLCFLFFIAPLEVVLGEGEGEVGGRLFVDPIEQVGDLIVPLRSDVLGRVIKTEILSHPLVIVPKFVVGLVSFVFLIEELSSNLLANL